LIQQSYRCLAKYFSYPLDREASGNVPEKKHYVLDLYQTASRRCAATRATSRLLTIANKVSAFCKNWFHISLLFLQSLSKVPDFLR
jgi:hypothetical protein